MSVRLVIALLFAAAATAEDCEDGWTVSKVAGSCYKMINGQSFWDAEAECALDGAHLTSILTDEENQFIDDMVNTKIPGKEIWVGGYLMTKAKTQFHWMDETPIDMNSVIWNKAGQPDVTRKEHCIRKNSNGSLEQGFCDALYKGICKRPIGQVAPKLETPLCDEGWEGSKWSGSCYKLTPASKSGAANEYCLGLNATLASANSFLEKEFILEKAKAVEKDTDTWLGAKRGADGVFTWNDGSKWETGYWNSDLPEKPDNTKNCLLVCNHLSSATAHRYFPWDCNTEHMGMCKKLTGKITKSGDAQEECFAADAQPASVLSFLEKEFILDLAKQANTTAVWLGARRGTNGRFEWIDQSKWDNAYWSVTGPSTSGTDKNCLVLFGKVDNDATILNRWAEHDCGGTAMGVCKKPGKTKA
ncbi:unnamed protein product, partial [Mesorhabditis spiculigera]